MYPFDRITGGVCRLYVCECPIEQLRPKLCQLKHIPGKLLVGLAVEVVEAGYRVSILVLDLASSIPRVKTSCEATPRPVQ